MITLQRLQPSPVSMPAPTVRWSSQESCTIIRGGGCSESPGRTGFRQISKRGLALLSRAATPRRSGSTMSQEIALRPGLADVPVAESAVSFIDGQRALLAYRGISAETLARESCFEETAYLLLKGNLPTQRELALFDDAVRHHRRIKYKLKDLIKCLPE